MKPKIAITIEQAEQFNKMRKALRMIYKDYYSSEQLQNKSPKLYGCSYNEAIEMSYENIQALAKNAAVGIREIKFIQPTPEDSKEVLQGGI